jgi:hypothetical protein
VPAMGIFRYLTVWRSLGGKNWDFLVLEPGRSLPQPSGKTTLQTVWPKLVHNHHHQDVVGCKTVSPSRGSSCCHVEFASAMYMLWLTNLPGIYHRTITNFERLFKLKMQSVIRFVQAERSSRFFEDLCYR